MSDEGAVTMQTPRQIAATYQVHFRTVLRWIKAGLPATNVGSPARPDWRIEPDDVVAWLAQRHEPAPS